jgi:hypothetical protein
MSKADPRAKHTARVLSEYPHERLRVLLLLAKRFGYWSHIDWGVVEAELEKNA